MRVESAAINARVILNDKRTGKKIRKSPEARVDERCMVYAYLDDAAVCKRRSCSLSNEENTSCIFSRDHVSVTRTGKTV